MTRRQWMEAVTLIMATLFLATVAVVVTVSLLSDLPCPTQQESTP